MNTSISTELFNSYVQRSVLYELQKKKEIETGPLLLNKKKMGLRPRGPIHDGDLGRFPRPLNCCIGVMRCWMKLIRMNVGILPKQAY